MVSCPICGESLSSSKGYSAHKRWNHSEEDELTEQRALLKEILRIAVELEKTPTQQEFAEQSDVFGYTSAKRLFGSWYNTIDLIGLIKNENATRAELITVLQRLAKKLNKVPTATELAKHTKFSSTTYQREFGTWNSAIEAAGMSVSVRTDITSDEVVEDLYELRDSIDTTPTQSEFIEYVDYSLGIVIRRFGSYNELLRSTNLKENYRIYDREELLDNLKCIARSIDGDLTRDKFVECSEISVNPYYNEFGSWCNALAEIGIDRIATIDQYTEEGLKNQIMWVYDTLGRPPSLHEVPASQSAYETAFGSWNNAVREVGLSPRSRYTHDRRHSVDFGNNWYTQRRKALERDGHKCRLCGNSDLVHVHHIKPRSDFNDQDKMNDIDNLITLCPSHHKTYEGQFKECNHKEFEKSITGPKDF